MYLETKKMLSECDQSLKENWLLKLYNSGLGFSFFLGFIVPRGGLPLEH